MRNICVFKLRTTNSVYMGHLFKNGRIIIWFCINNFLLGLQEEVHKYVQMMGGRVCRDLNISVTHLIAGEVGSKKYLVAANPKGNLFCFLLG